MKRIPKPRRGPKLPSLRDALPNAVGVAAIEGVLDAVEKGAVESGLKGSAPAAMRAIFGMLLGSALDEKKCATLSLEGMEPVLISKVDAQFVAMKSLAELTRLEVGHVVHHLVESGALPFKTIGNSLSVRAGNVLARLFGLDKLLKGHREARDALLDLTPEALKAKLVDLSVERKHPVSWLLRATYGCGNVVTKEILDWIGPLPSTE